MFVFIKCPCGRTLRANRSSDRAVIQCWDCKTEVAVPRFRTADGPKPIARLRGAMATEWAETAAAVVLLALAVAAVVAVPEVGRWLGLGLLVCAMIFYLKRIEDVGRREQAGTGSEPRPLGPWGSLGRLAIAVVLVAGFVAPIWLFDGSGATEYVEPVLPSPWPLVVMLSIWVLLPLVAYALVARDSEGALGLDLAMSAAWRRRGLTLVALLLPLAVFVVVEHSILGLLAWKGGLSTVLLDVFPLAEGHEIISKTVVSNDEARFEPRAALKIYGSGVSRGATLLSAVPLSFLRGPEPRIMVIAYGLFKSESYLLARLAITAVAMLSLFSALAIQAHLLGRVGLASPRTNPEEAEGDAEYVAPDPPRPAPATGSRAVV